MPISARDRQDRRLERRQSVLGGTSAHTRISSAAARLRNRHLRRRVNVSASARTHAGVMARPATLVPTVTGRVAGVAPVMASAASRVARIAAVDSRIFRGAARLACRTSSLQDPCEGKPDGHASGKEQHRIGPSGPPSLGCQVLDRPGPNLFCQLSQRIRQPPGVGGQSPRVGPMTLVVPLPRSTHRRPAPRGRRPRRCWRRAAVCPLPSPNRRRVTGQPFQPRACWRSCR